MNDRLEKETEKKVNQDDDFEISIKSNSNEEAYLTITGTRTSIINGLGNLLENMIEENIISFYELDLLVRKVTEKNEKGEEYEQKSNNM